MPFEKKHIACRGVPDTQQVSAMKEKKKKPRNFFMKIYPTYLGKKSSKLIAFI